jgi:hypothetical protein
MANPIVQQINDELSELQKELTKFKNTVDYLNGAKSSVEDAVLKVNHSEAHFSKKVEELKATYNSIIGLSQKVSSVMDKLDTINFPERLDSIEKSVKSTIETLEDTKNKTLIELQKASEVVLNANFEQKFNDLQLLVNDSVRSNDELTTKIENLNLGDKINVFQEEVSKIIYDTYKDLENNTNQISINSAKAIAELNIPERIENIDSIISNQQLELEKMNSNISRIEALVQSLKDNIYSIKKNINDTLTDSIDKQLTLLKSIEVNIAIKLQETTNSIENNFSKLEKKQSKRHYSTISLLVLILISIIVVIYSK